MKDAGRKAALARDSPAAARKAAEPRRKNREARQAEEAALQKLRAVEVDTSSTRR
jgi:hypothetical protein